MMRTASALLVGILSLQSFGYYMPEAGRWLSRDPAGEAQGPNLYHFVGNNPVQHVDRLGLALYAFDGTGNSLEKSWTHVFSLYRSYEELAHYEPGVGNTWYSFLPGGFSGVGARARLDRMYKRLVDTYDNGDQKIDIIGFSRGAALAREFANMIYEKGITYKKYSRQKRTMGTRSMGWRQVLTSQREIACAPPIRFVGLFDTVGSFVIPGNHINPGIRMDLPPNVQHAAHAVAGHERRSAFPLTPLNSPIAGQHFDERVFRGDHSDIGGGHQEDQNLLSICPLLYIHAQGRSVGVPFGGLRYDMEQGRLFVDIHRGTDVLRRPWAIQYSMTPHDLTSKWYFRDGGPRDNLPGEIPQ